jgi:hypothetical protein
MTRNSLLKGAAAAALFLSILVAGRMAAAAQPGITYSNQDKIEFTVDVAEDMNKYAEHRTEAGVEPIRGSQFVTEGNIYPAGTIVGKGEEFDPNLPGSQGTWFCKGVFLVKGSEFDKSPLAVVSDQIYLLAGDQHSVATTGAEGNGTSTRVVTGGTGAFAGYVGEQRQQFLGFNKSGGVNLRVTISLRKASK